MQGSNDMHPQEDGTNKAQQTGADPSIDAPEIMPSVEELLRDAELKAAEHHDAWLRAKADAENIRRRAHEDVQNAHKYAIAKFATDLLAVKDSLEMALKDNSSIENIKVGVEMTLKQLVNAFDKVQLSEINPMGEKLDPHKHQAISVVPADAEPNTVVNVMQKGYQLADRVIRPAMVVVAKAKD